MSKLPAKQRTVKASEVVNIICSYAYENGLNPNSLSTIIDLITKPSYLDQSSITAIIKNLYPASKVSNDVVFRLVGSLGSGKGKSSAATQALLIRWLILVYEVLMDSSVLSKLYGVLFNMLDMISLRYITPSPFNGFSLCGRVFQCPVMSLTVPDHSAEACQTFQNTDAVSAG